MNNKGFVFVSSMLFFVVVSLLGITSTTIISQESKRSVGMMRNSQALYLAEAGISKGIRNLIDTEGSYTGEIDTSLGNGMFSVIVSTLGVNMYKIKAIGYIPDSSNPKYTKEVNSVLDFRSFEEHSIFNNAIGVKSNMSLENLAYIDSYGVLGNGEVRANGEINMKADAKVCGDVYAITKIKLDNNAIIDGDAYSSNIELKGSSIITGNQYSNVDSLTFPTLDMNKYKNKALMGGVFNGDKIISSGINMLGPLYIKGKLEIKNTAIVTLIGPVYAEGNIAIENTAKVSGEYMLCAEGKVYIKNSAEIGENDSLVGIITSSNDVSKAVNIANLLTTINAVIYAPNGGIEHSNTSVLNGALIANKVKVKNTAKIYWVNPSSYSLDFPGSMAKPKTISWEEE